jgi:hypothetical protein
MDAGRSKQVLHHHAAPMIRTPIINLLDRPASRDSDSVHLILLLCCSFLMEPQACMHQQPGGSCWCAAYSLSSLLDLFCFFLAPKLLDLISFLPWYYLICLFKKTS